MKREHQSSEQRYGILVDAYLAGGKVTRSGILALCRSVGDMDYQRGYTQCERKWAKDYKAQARRASRGEAA